MQHRRRGKVEPFVGIPKRMFRSPAFRCLPASARSLLFELQDLFNGENNGQLYLGGRDAARLMGASQDTAYTAFKTLQERGFIVPTSAGSFGIKERHATCWRLTWRWADGRAATHDYEAWRPESGSREEKRLKALNDCNLRSAKSALAALESQADAEKPREDHCSTAGKFPTESSEDGQLSVNALNGKIPTQLDYHGEGARRATYEQCHKVRQMAQQRLKTTGYGGQRRLHRLAGLTESRLSRFLNDPGGRRTLTVDELDRLRTAVVQLALRSRSTP